MSMHNTYSLSTLNREDRISGLINSLKVGILLFDPALEIIYSNDTACYMLGLAEEELLGKSSFYAAWNVVHEDGSAFTPDICPVTEAIRTGAEVNDIVMGIYRPNAKDRVWLLVNAKPLFDEYGDLKEVVCSFSDISRLKESEDKLTLLYQKLETRAFELSSSNADLERFIYVATHDLQEPLRHITSFMQLLEKKMGNLLDGQARQYIKYAVDGSARMKKLILDLLEYSKFSSKRQHFSLTDMNKIASGIKQAYIISLKETGGELVVEDLPVICSDSVLITQLLENLVDNAIKYKGSLPLCIQISCTEKQENYQFSISDNGIGIEPEYAKKIFNLFQRLHNNEAYDGTGVGLAICKKIVQLHWGDIWVESEPGQGSRFCFTIPKFIDGNEKL